MAKKCICFDIDTIDIDFENIITPAIDIDAEPAIEKCSCDEVDLND